MVITHSLIVTLTPCLPDKSSLSPTQTQTQWGFLSTTMKYRKYYHIVFAFLIFFIASYDLIFLSKVM